MVADTILTILDYALLVAVVWVFAEVTLAFCISDPYNPETGEYVQPAGGFLRAYLRKRRDH